MGVLAKIIAYIVGFLAIGLLFYVFLVPSPFGDVLEILIHPISILAIIVGGAVVMYIRRQR